MHALLPLPRERSSTSQAVLALKLDDGESLAVKVGHFLDGHHDEAKSPAGRTSGAGPSLGFVWLVWDSFRILFRVCLGL